MNGILILSSCLATFVLGFGAGFLMRIGYTAECRRRAIVAEQNARDLIQACREVLSDAFFTKVRRRFVGIANSQVRQ